MRQVERRAGSSVIWFAVLCVLGSCAEDLRIDTVQWACQNTTDCRVGFTCVSGVCSKNSAQVSDTVTPQPDTAGNDPGGLPDPGPDVASTGPVGPWVEVAACATHSCAINHLGAIRCWGSDDKKQIREVPIVGDWHNIVCGRDFSCALDSDAKPFCWGTHLWALHEPPDKAFTKLAAGDLVVCGIRTDTFLECWGYSIALQTLPPENVAAVDVAMGYSHGCAVMEDGTVSCWGDDALGKSTPTVGLPKVRYVAASTMWDVNITWALGESGHVLGWGAAGDTVQSVPITFEISPGSLCQRFANGLVECENIADPPASKVFESLGPGWDHQCGILADKSIYCWGDPTDGKLVAPP